MDKILSIQNLSSVIYPEDPHMQMQFQMHLQELQRPHQQAQLPISPIGNADNSLIPPIHNGANGTNGTNGDSNKSPQSDDNCSRNSSLISTNGHKKTTIEVNHVDLTEKELIDLVTCKLCKGYLIDAATLDLCMHTFCRPCAVKYIRERPRCPECNLEIKDKRFLNRLKTDTTMQSIVYKLVPGLYEKEMARRRSFYAARPSPTPRYRSEMFGDIPPAKTIKPDDMFSISLTWLKPTPDLEPIKVYFFCRADTTMLAIKKLIIGKFGLDRLVKIYYGATEILFDLTALMDVAATFNWNPENKILNLSFKEQDSSKDSAIIKKTSQMTEANFSPPTNPDRAP